jgi:hypothetical protein
MAAETFGLVRELGQQRVRTAARGVLLALALIMASGGVPGAPAQSSGLPVRLRRHVLPALAQATRVAASARAANAESQPLTLTVVLNRQDEAGLQQYLADVENPASPNHLRFLSQQQLSDRFGPTKQSYNAVLAWLQSKGFTLSQGSTNRLTLTVKGTRAQAETAFQLSIGDYRLGSRSFYANDQDPAMPASIAANVQAITGLSNLARPDLPSPDIQNSNASPEEKCLIQNSGPPTLGNQTPQEVLEILQQQAPASFASILAVQSTMGACLAATEIGRLLCLSVTYDNPAATCDPSPGSGAGATAEHDRATGATTGAAEKVGLLEFDTFRPSDVGDWLQFVGANRISASSMANPSQVSAVNVNGGVATPGRGEPEVLLDIDAVLAIAPSAQVTVYDAPSSTSFQSLFNAMLTDPSGPPSIISNSWAYCEDETSQADVESLDAILASASASGVSVFNAAGDSGSTCLDGSPKTVEVPADSPHATAVGGTSVLPGTAFTYGSERWWDDSQQTPRSGQGGYGVSRFFGRPSYQDGLTSSAMRSVPDVAANADPLDGFQICEADSGGCPDGLFYGGTSLAAPEWAAMAALLDQMQGHPLGQLNPLLAPLAATPAFHTAVSMGSDFAHVGLGSPNLDALSLALRASVSGGVSPATASVVALPAFSPADGTTPATILVRLVDGAGNGVSGKGVSIAAGSSSHAVISAASGPSSTDGGAVTFSVTDGTIEEVTFTATDTTDDVVLSQAASIDFVSPPATTGSITGNPASVAASGYNYAEITISLQNAKGQPASGKQVVLSQGDGHSSLASPSGGSVPGEDLTDQNGQVRFEASDSVAESVTYTAIDVTDGDLGVPGSATVAFTNGPTSLCGSSTLQTSADYAATTFASGFAYNGNCFSPSGLAFDPAGNLVVVNYGDGYLYRFGPSGGVASAATRVNSTSYANGLLNGVAFGKDGRLYVVFSGSYGSPTIPSVAELDPTTGAVVRTVLGGVVSRPEDLAVDPFTGDLFLSQVNNEPGSVITRISNPASANPTYSTYAATGDVDALSFAPDGTLYALQRGSPDTLIRIDGTNTSTPGAFTTLASIDSADGVAIAPSLTDPAHPLAIYVTRTDGRITQVDLSTNPPTLTDIVSGGSRGDEMVVGPDGCLYADQTDRVLKVTKADGTCPIQVTSGYQLSLSPATVSPNPTTGTTVSVSATLHNAQSPAGVPVDFTVSGANPQTKQVAADASGQATFSYVGVQIGADTILATAAVPATSGTGTTRLTSNPASVTWEKGRDVTFLGLNTSATSGFQGALATLSAQLTDVSTSSPTPVPGQPVTLAVSGQSCQATTDATGMAICSLAPSGAPGSYPLIASYVGSSQYTPSSADETFTVSTCGLGDVNCDGVVNSTDALCVLRSVATLPPTAACPSPVPANGHVSTDAQISSLDALCILRHVATLPGTSACPAWGSQPPGSGSRQPAIGNRMVPAPTQSSEWAGVFGHGALSVSPSSADAHKGRRTSVTVRVDATGRALGSWTVDLTYDPKAMKVTGCTAADGGVCNTSFAPGVVRLVGASVSGLSGSRSIATLQFEGLGGSGPSPLAVTTVTLADTEGGQLAASQ